jgi:hypothetical protein
MPLCALQAFSRLAQDFPVSSRMMLENLQRAAQQRVDGEFARAGMSHMLTPELLQAFLSSQARAPGSSGGGAAGPEVFAPQVGSGGGG